ncbi:MAG: hypothetical protein AB7F76_13165 [Parvibaculaceae bacterium]|jgi:hypothetical protein
MFRRRSYLRIPAIFYIYVAALAGMTAFAASHIDATPDTPAPVRLVSR